MRNPGKGVREKGIADVLAKGRAEGVAENTLTCI